ncbi:MAG: phenylalanine--tRNA ligase subunit beta [Campylobacteraceae bacterium]|jgi:phenylalanyl-tRNA synthetase beta chain|nr:phenylalanine--tRNA ligase subunit beta [Campylobacteraceae bacterium]
MIITRNWLNEWIDLGERNAEELCKTLNKIGLEVSSITKYRMIEHCVAGFVKTKEQHPNAEKLSVCSVDVGRDEDLQIVCGAKNVDAGQFVAVALEGCRLPNGTVIQETVLRGVKSQGMICSSTELGYPKINEGIMILDNNSKEFKPGTPLISIPEFRDDVIEIELTPNRGDCLSIYGIARDLCAVYNSKIKIPSILPDDLEQIGIGRVLELSVKGDTQASLIYKVLSQKGLKNSLIVDLRLAMTGYDTQKSLMDKYLSYATHATGVILRAYKMDAFEYVKSKTANVNVDENKKVEIVVKKGENGLDMVFGKEQVSCVGVWQDENSKPSDDDDLMVIEASFIDPYVLGQNGARNIKESDFALFRSLRGSEPNLDFGINYLSVLLNSISKVGILTGSQRTIKERTLKQINIDFEDVFNIIGAEINKTDIVFILKNLGFYPIFRPEQNLLVVDIPSFRHDVANIQDICEEIVRIVGIDNIRSKPLKFIELNRTNGVYKNFEKKKFYRHKAAAAGFFENVSYVFTERAKQLLYGFTCVDEDIDLANPITNELNTLRTTCALSLAGAASGNVKAGKKSVNLFEVGKVFNAKREEKVVLTFISSGESELPSLINHGKPQDIDFGLFVRKIGAVLGNIEIIPSKPNNRFYSPYEFGEIVVNSEGIGFAGRVAVAKDYDLGKTYICEVDFDKLSYERKIAKPYSKLPNVSRDLSLLAPKHITFEDISRCVKERAPKELKDFYPIDIYSDDSLGDKQSITLTFVFGSDERTFVDEEINNFIEQILEGLLIVLKITIR